MKMRELIGKISASLAILFSIYILLMILNIAPGVGIFILHEPFIRFIAQVTVLLYLLAAWAFWHI